MTLDRDKARAVLRRELGIAAEPFDSALNALEASVLPDPRIARIRELLDRNTEVVGGDLVEYLIDQDDIRAILDAPTT